MGFESILKTAGVSPGLLSQFSGGGMDINSLLGPDFNYKKAMNSPEEMGLSAESDALAKDMDAPIQYIKVLMAGNGPANKAGSDKFIGNRFFVPTGSKCENGQSRFMYVNNIPSSQGTLAGGGSGKAPDGSEIFSPYRGIIPGILFDAMEMVPTDMYQAFGNSKQECVNPTLDVVGQNESGDLIQSTSSRWIAKSDAMKIDPCAFPNNVNPYAPKGRQNCVETPEQAEALRKQIAAEGMTAMKRENGIPNDRFVQLYVLLISLLGLYIASKYILSSKNK
tara:strand:+ start:4177 stop:5013 length:837 start_codon:yes stop_codon:yes gene_type:complete